MKHEGRKVPIAESRKSPRWLRWALLTVGIAALNLICLGAHGLFEPDEGRYANMALEWLEFDEHHWAEPTLSDVGHFDKPPLIYWVTGLCLKAFGTNEMAARLPSFLGSVLALTGVGLLAYRQYGERTAFWAVIVCATSIHFWALAHLLSPDMLLCGFCTLGTALCLWGGKGAQKWTLWILGAVCWSFAWWTKATAALVPLGAVSLALLLCNRRDLLKSLKPLRVLLIILILGSPWYLAMMMRHEELTDFFLHREVIGRIVGHADGRKGFFGYHFAVAIGFWLPWWPILAKVAWSKRHQWGKQVWKSRIRQIPWEIPAALGVVLIFSLVSSKLITYVITGVPFLAIAVARVIHAEGFLKRRWPVRLVSTMAILFIAVSCSLSFFETSLGRNSSLRKIVRLARENGAQWIICDRFMPGLKFYMGEAVWYVDVKDIVQVPKMQGQDSFQHFISKDEIDQRLRDMPMSVWLLQTNNNPKPWERQLIAERKDFQAKPIRVGDFQLWKVH